MKRRGLTSTVGFRVRTKFKELSARRAGVSPLLRFLCVPLERVKNLPPGCAADGVSWIDALHTLSTCLAGRNSRLLGPKKQNSGSVSTEIRPCFAFTCSFCFLRSFSFFSLTVCFFLTGGEEDTPHLVGEAAFNFVIMLFGRVFVSLVLWSGRSRFVVSFFVCECVCVRYYPCDVERQKNALLCIKLHTSLYIAEPQK